MGKLLDEIDEEYDEKCKHCGHTKEEHYGENRNFECGMHQQIGPHAKINQCSCPGFKGGLSTTKFEVNNESK